MTRTSRPSPRRNAVAQSRPRGRGGPAAAEKAAMAIIQNLYILPDPAARETEALLEALVTRDYLRGPSIVGPAWRQDPDAPAHAPEIVEPRAALGAPILPPYAPSATRSADPVAALADYHARDGARLCAAPMNAAHPEIARDFDHYQGYEWALGIYSVPEGHRLLRHHEVWEFDESGAPLGEPEVAIDQTLRVWIHLQGKAAPWPDLYVGSALDSLVRSFWPEPGLFEFPYF